MVQQLQCVADVLGGSLRRPRANRGVATIERAAPLGAAPQVDDTAAVHGNPRQHGATRHRAAVNAGAAVG